MRCRVLWLFVAVGVVGNAVVAQFVFVVDCGALSLFGVWCYIYLSLCSWRCAVCYCCLVFVLRWLLAAVSWLLL